ncbi:MAG: small multi-drug export protein [Ruminococcaceae bacterium]|nr:small multi-drug export protein [Oscillospiraceae bacterium]
MTEILLEFFSKTIPAELTVFIMSMIPLVELRGGILAAKVLGLDLIPAFLICAAGTILPIPFILLFIRKIFDWMRNTKLVKLVDKLEEKGRSKISQIEKYKNIGLIIFVGIPLPGTGAWTGALAASLMKMKFKPAILSILIGTLLADLIMCLISYGVLGIFF